MYQRPKTLVTFSYDADHNLHLGSNSSLRYFSEPPPRADLNYGYDRWIKRDEERGRLDSLLKSLEYGSAAVQAASRPSTVTWRGVMTKYAEPVGPFFRLLHLRNSVRIVTAPYEQRDGWELNAMMVGPLIFLEEHLSEDRLQEKQAGS